MYLWVLIAIPLDTLILKGTNVIWNAGWLCVCCTLLLMQWYTALLCSRKKSFVYTILKLKQLYVMHIFFFKHVGSCMSFHLNLEEQQSTTPIHLANIPSISKLLLPLIFWVLFDHSFYSFFKISCILLWFVLSLKKIEIWLIILHIWKLI
jgi:hypothetical protein